MTVTASVVGGAPPRSPDLPGIVMMGGMGGSHPVPGTVIVNCDPSITVTLIGPSLATEEYKTGTNKT